MDALSDVRAALAHDLHGTWEDDWLVVADNEVELDMTERDGTLLLFRIEALHTGTGLGTRVMESLWAHVQERGLRLVVQDVTNPRYFERFAWLEPTGEAGAFGEHYLAAPPPSP